MSLHPLRSAYVDAVKKQFNITLWGDKNTQLTEQAAMKIVKLGLDYRVYVEVALKLCAGVTKANGWPYPYYNVVIGDKTLDRVYKLLQYTEEVTTGEGGTDLFEHELIYATEYIEWWFGRGDKPSHGDVVVPGKVRSDVAAYLCKVYGIPFLSSNYNVICKALESTGGQ